MVKRDPGCTRCPLHQTAEHVCLLGVGPKHAEVMLIGEAPGEQEDNSGVPFVGRSGKLLDEMLTHAGLSRDDIYITNAVSCRPPNNRPPAKREMNECKYWLDKQLAEVKPKYVGLLGAVALEQVLGVKGIKKLRGRPIEKDGVTYLPMYHPSYILRGEGVDQPTAEQDFRKLKDIQEFGGIPEERALNYTIVDTWERVDEMIDAMTGLVSFDLETTGLYPWDDGAQIVSIGVGTSKGEYLVPAYHKESPWTEEDLEHIVIDRMSEQIRHCVTIAHNGKFDSLWIYVHYDQLWRVTFDTMLAHYIIDENARHGLEHLASIYLAAPDWDISLAEKQGGASYERIAKYHAHDVYYTRKLYPKLKQLLAEDPLVKRLFEQLVMPIANLYVEMEAHGCYLDLTKMDEVEQYLRAEIDKAQRRLSKWGDILWSSPKQVADLLYGKLKIKCPIRTKKGAQSTGESALKMIDHPCVTDLLAFRGHKQMLSFFIEGWKPYIQNKRIHPSFKLHGTVTGRPSCEHPNFQQVPRDSRIRSLITSPPGWALIEADLSQIEMRIAAELSRDSEMVQCFQFGIDVHWRTLMTSIGRGADYAEQLQKTAAMYCLQQSLPPNGDGTKILLEVWAKNKNRSQTQKLLEEWQARALTRFGKKSEKVSSMSGDVSTHRDSPAVLSPMSKDRDRGKSQTPSDEDGSSSRNRVGRKSGWREEPLLERGDQFDHSREEASQELLRALQHYEREVRPTPQGPGSNEWQSIKFSDALSLVSSIGPQQADKVFPDYWQEKRKKAKSQGFGFLYGMGGKKFVTYAKDNYDITVTLDEALQMRKQFFDLYSGLPGWHESQRRFAHQKGYVRSMSGRKRRLPQARSKEDSPERGEAYRQAINAPVQGFASDINLMVLLQMRKEFSSRVFKPVITVHDSILMEVREDHVEQVVHRIEEIMRRPDLFDDFGIKLTVPIEGETKIGPWGSGVSFKRWKK